MKLALYKSSKGTLLDKTIDLGSGCYGYSHNELVFSRMPEGMNNQGDYLCFSSSPREGECRFKHIDIYSGNWHVIDLDDHFTIEEEREMFDEANTYVGDKYDYYGILFYFVLFWMKRQKDNQWWCSEIGSKILKWEDFRVTPNKMARVYGAPKSDFTFKFIWRKNY